MKVRRTTRRNPSDLERALAGDKNLEGANLQGAYIADAYLEGANLRGANLQKANLQYADLKGADLKGAYIAGAGLQGAYLEGANLKGAYLTGANLEDAYLKGAYLTGANLVSANLQYANLVSANLQYANLKAANLEGAYLEGADLTGANLEGANLEGANLTGANLESANLTDANLKGTNLPVPEVQVLPVVTPTSDAFYRWFGESKIVNADGSPRVLYHGTDKAVFTAFSLEKIDKWHPGFFFADTPELAKTYTSSRQFDPFAVDKSKGIYRIYVKMERPFVYDCEGALWSAIKFEGKKVKTDDIGHWAKANGYDGVILLNVIDEGEYRAGLGPQTVYIVFNPGNIKSATYNVGTWDPNDPDIRHNPPSRLRRLKVQR